MRLGTNVTPRLHFEVLSNGRWGRPKALNKKGQGVPQSQAAADPQHQKEEEKSNACRINKLMPKSI